MPKVPADLQTRWSRYIGESLLALTLTVTAQQLASYTLLLIHAHFE